MKYELDQKEIATTVQFLLENSELSPKDLADILGLSKDSIYRKLKNADMASKDKRDFTLDDLIHICNYFQLDINDILKPKEYKKIAIEDALKEVIQSFNSICKELKYIKTAIDNIMEALKKA